MSSKVDALVQTVNRLILIYIIGSGCFVLVALASVWFGYYLIRYHANHELPLPLIVFSFAGVLLLWEIAKSFRIRATLPSSFIPITEREYPALFNLIFGVTEALHLSPISKVYICPDTKAAVFIQPKLRNLLREPERNLVIGLGFLTQLDDEEMRAVLYHEFGHYVQKEMKSSVSVYVFGQFARSFVAVKDSKRLGVWEMQRQSQLLLFTYFTQCICHHINKIYASLAKQMEYDADDVAVRYVGVPTMQRTLLHAACVRYNYSVLQWGTEALRARNIVVDKPYLALRYVEIYSRPDRQQLSAEVVKRVERLGKLKNIKSSASRLVQFESVRFTAYRSSSGTLCSARQFARWLQKGFLIYAQQKLLSTSVQLEIHLDRKRHRFPFFDGSYKLLLDGKEVGEGNFIKGYTLKLRISPGHHAITAYAPTGIISTAFEFKAEQNCSYRIEMDYKFLAKLGVFNIFGEKINMI